jgi:hypothetical protein
MTVATFPFKSTKTKLLEILSLLALGTTFFSSFIGTTILGFVFITLIIVLEIGKLKLSIFQLAVLALLFFYMFILFFLANDYIVVTKNFRFWLGVIFYILYLKLYPETRIASRFFFRVVAISVIIEAIIINTIIPAPVFYNNHPHAVLFIFYYRPLSFGGNASMSSAALVCLYFVMSKYGHQKVKRFDQLLLVSATLLFFSGSGLLAYLLMLLYKNIFEKKINSRRNIKIILFSFSFLLLILLIMFNLDYEKVPKFSIQYYSFLFDFKIEQYKQVVNFDGLKSWLFGNQLTDLLENTSGDFGWLGLIAAMGLLGLSLYFLILFSFYKGNIFSNSIFIILFISTFHYPAAMSGAGQFITAFIITYKKKRINDV